VKQCIQNIVKDLDELDAFKKALSAKLRFIKITDVKNPENKYLQARLDITVDKKRFQVFRYCTKDEEKLVQNNNPDKLIEIRSELVNKLKITISDFKKSQLT
jgi:hypothetical protein